MKLKLYFILMVALKLISVFLKANKSENYVVIASYKDWSFDFIFNHKDKLESEKW